jgi:hypothetical protein
VDLELARQQWEEGNRRLEEARDDRRTYRRLLGEIDIVTRELRRRVGETFSLQELADAYAAADGWSRLALDDARPEEAPPPDVATATDAAFHAYARGASDFAP